MARQPRLHAVLAAYHEAGHAVLAWRHGFAIARIDMTTPAVELRPVCTAVFAFGVPVRVAPGRFKLVVPTLGVDRRDRLLPEAERHAQELLAGNLALRRRYPRVSAAVALARYGGEDHRRVHNLALAFHPGDEAAAQRWVRAQERATHRLLHEPPLWAAVEALAALLTPGTRLPGSEAEVVIARAVGSHG